MPENQLFQKLLPININFVQGESPSPTKLTGIFNYIQASYYILESYLGNGIDYGISTMANRKMVFNLASTIGAASNIYKPINKLTSLYNIHKSFGALHKDSGAPAVFGDSLHVQHTEYVSGNLVTTEKLQVLTEINIPICQQDIKNNGHQLGIIYKGSGSITIYNGDNTTSTITCELSATGLKQKTLAITSSYIDYIKLTPVSSFEIYSLWLVDNQEGLYCDDGNEAGKGFIFNSACAMPIDNGLQANESFWKIAPPCQHASVSAGADRCPLRTCSRCIGNTYDVFVDQNGVTPWNPVGQPICGGDVGLLPADTYKGQIAASLIPKNSSNQTIKYTPVQYTEQSTSLIYTIQSCLLMKSKPYMAKFRPFAGHDGLNSELTLQKNSAMLYDMNASYNPIRYNITLRSAGRPDIIYVHDTNRELIANSYNKVTIVGGSYSMSALLKDILTVLDEKQKPQVSVYSD